MKTILSKLAAGVAWWLLKLAYPQYMTGVEVVVCLRGYAENVGDGRERRGGRFGFLLKGRDQ